MDRQIEMPVHNVIQSVRKEGVMFEIKLQHLPSESS